MDELKVRQDLYNGFGDTLARGFELAVMPFLFGGIGFVLDRALGTTPGLTIVLTVFCLIGLSVRMYYGYATAMRHHEAAAPWWRDRTAGAAGPAAACGLGAPSGVVAAPGDDGGPR